MLTFSTCANQAPKSYIIHFPQCNSVVLFYFPCLVNAYNSQNPHPHLTMLTYFAVKYIVSKNTPDNITGVVFLYLTKLPQSHYLTVFTDWVTLFITSKLTLMGKMRNKINKERKLRIGCISCWVSFICSFSSVGNRVDLWIPVWFAHNVKLQLSIQNRVIYCTKARWDAGQVRGGGLPRWLPILRWGAWKGVSHYDASEIRCHTGKWERNWFETAILEICIKFVFPSLIITFVNS